MREEEQTKKDIDKVIEEHVQNFPPEKRVELTSALKKVFTGVNSPKEAFKIDGNLLTTAYAYAYTLFQARKFKEAEFLFFFLLQMDPKNISYAKALAFTYKEQNMVDMASLAYCNWALLDPLNPIPPYYRAELHMDHKNDYEAYLAYAECILKSVGNEVYRSLREKAHLNMQCLEDRLKERLKEELPSEKQKTETK